MPRNTFVKAYNYIRKNTMRFLPLVPDIQVVTSLHPLIHLLISILILITILIITLSLLDSD